MKDPLADLESLLQQLHLRISAQPRYADLRNLRALAHAHRGDWDAAREDLEVALQSNAAYEDALFNRAWLDLQSRANALEAKPCPDTARLPQAQQRLLEVLRTVHAEGVQEALRQLVDESNPQDDRGLVLCRLWLLVRAERLVEAEAELVRIAGLEPDLPVLLEEAGLFENGLPSRSGLAAWASCYRGNPRVSALCTAKAELAQREDSMDESRRFLAWGTAMSLDTCAYWLGVGLGFESSGDERRALDAIRRAVHADPQRVEARVTLGFQFAARGLVGEAIAELEKAAELAPGYADVRYELGLLYTEVGRRDDAEIELRAACKSQPDYLPAQLALGFLLTSTGQDPEALELLQKVRRAGVRSADLEMRLALLHQRLGHDNQARRARVRAQAATRASMACMSSEEGETD